MNKVYESIMTGLSEAIEDAQSGNKKLHKRTVTIIPVKEYQADQIKEIRKNVSMSQKTFASYLGVSEKTVEAWEAGTNHPSGSASRILSMMEMDSDLTKKYPFVKAIGQ
jgi:putative transcriptional regulator